MCPKAQQTSDSDNLIVLFLSLKYLINLASMASFEDV